MDSLMSLLQISKESVRAPGLPSPPSERVINFVSQATRYLPVLSINYDSLPMALESPKTFWVDLNSPAPPDLQVGSPARLHVTLNSGVRTSLNTGDPLNSVFHVEDIIGSRVILSPYQGSAWLPNGCDNPFGWGYNMQVANILTGMHSTKYGYGTPVSYLEYHPAYYSSRVMQHEKKCCRNSSHISGWYM